MKKVMASLKFIFRNGETWTVSREHIGDLWIKQVTTSYGRIGNSEFQEIHPCESLRIEIFQEADHVKSDDINLGGIEAGMFDRVAKYQDIEMMDILYVDENHPKSDVIVQSDRIYFPYKAMDTDGNDNEYQTSKESDGCLYVVIDPNKSVADIYPNK
ncbi:hypothetical protein [Jeotgalibaca caeni]|uniref:hypothetical protein n=1 Tax=Jeotgalibaca caeni TaxID=3028623 RepID=UPI00237DC471|nr:hypothetical protein [Jeotgalibaca caeni]MDE1549359.1 hypothetical protein [Jeotgalibaca caeni]